MAKKNHVIASITYYVPCTDQDNFSFGIRGEYRQVTGMVWRVDTEMAQTITVDAMTMHFQDITKVESDEHLFDHSWEDIC